jgi:hypothetical protein
MTITQETTQVTYEQNARQTYVVVGHDALDIVLSTTRNIAAFCFTGALLTDWAYIKSPIMQWTNFSAWLLAVGMISAAIAIILALIDVLLRKGAPPTAMYWGYIGFSLAAAGLPSSTISFTAAMPGNLYGQPASHCRC